jgi:CRP-like cAMP-binding protein
VQERAGFRPVAIGGLIGGVSFVVINELLNKQGGFLRKRATMEQFLHDRRREDVMAVLSKLSGGKFLRSLPPEEIYAIVPHVQTVKYEKGARIFEQGATCDALYIVEDGEVELRASRNREAPEGQEREDIGHDAATSTLNRVGPGDAFGEISLLTGEPHSATAICLDDVTAWRIPSAEFHQLLAGSAPLSKAVSKLLHERLQSSDGQQPEKQIDAERWRKIACRYVEAHASAPTLEDLVRQLDSTPARLPWASSSGCCSTVFRSRS